MERNLNRKQSISGFRLNLQVWAFPCTWVHNNTCRRGS